MDRSYLKALHISAFSVLLFPLLGALLPFILWITKKDQIDGVDNHGKQIINFQIQKRPVYFFAYSKIRYKSILQYEVSPERCTGAVAGVMYNQNFALHTEKV